MKANTSTTTSVQTNGSNPTTKTALAKAQPKAGRLNTFLAALMRSFGAVPA